MVLFISWAESLAEVFMQVLWKLTLINERSFSLSSLWKERNRLQRSRCSGLAVPFLAERNWIRQLILDILRRSVPMSRSQVSFLLVSTLTTLWKELIKHLPSLLGRWLIILRHYLLNSIVFLEVISNLLVLCSPIHMLLEVSIVFAQDPCRVL